MFTLDILNVLRKYTIVGGVSGYRWDMKNTHDTFNHSNMLIYEC